MKLLVTGGAGFIGCNFARLAVSQGFEVAILDKLTYAGSTKNLADIQKNITLFHGDITSEKDAEKAMKGIDAVVHFAAETHVDRSISDAQPFVTSNIVGTFTLLEAAKRARVKKFVHISTDEVYGSKNSGSFAENDALDPRNPYSATKAAAEHLVRSFFATHGMNTVITRSSNNFGPYQNSEKFIPKLITNALAGKSLPIYGTGKNVRDWVYVEDNCTGIMKVLEKGRPGEVYNIGGGNEKTNVDIAKMIIDITKSTSKIEFVPDRPGHDFRYSMNIEKIKKIGWKPQHALRSAIAETSEWYSKNRWFW